jgi:hypothetical protein
LDLFQSLAASGEFGDDGVHGGGPDKGFGIVVPDGKEIFHCGDQRMINRASDAIPGHWHLQYARKDKIAPEIVRKKNDDWRESQSFGTEILLSHQWLTEVANDWRNSKFSKNRDWLTCQSFLQRLGR